MDELPDLSASQETLSLSLEESRCTFSRKIIPGKNWGKKNKLGFRQHLLYCLFALLPKLEA